MRKPGLGGTFWPDDVQEGLLRAAVLEPAAALVAWEEVRPRIDLSQLWDAESLRLLPLVYCNLVASGADDPDLDRLKGTYRRWWYANQVLLHRVSPTLDALIAAGIDLLLLKGVPLALHYYRDLGARPMQDVDVLVRPEQAEAAFAVLESSGWQSTRDQSLERALAARTADNLRHPDGAQIDLHWCASPLFRVRGASERPDDALWSRSEPLEVNGLAVRMPGAADLLLHVIVHGCWIDSASTVRWAADAATIVKVVGSDLDWERVLAQARSRNLVLVLRDALTYLERAVEVPVPAAVLHDLRAQPVSSRERRTYRILSGDGRAPEILGALPQTRARWVHRSNGWSRSRIARELPDYLRESWGLQRTSDVPRSAVQKAMRKLRGLPPAAFVEPARRARHPLRS